MSQSEPVSNGNEGVLHITRRTVVVLFNPQLGGLGGSYLSQGYLPESERNNATRVRTRVLQICSPSL